jgi:hypothetical protein
MSVVDCSGRIGEKDLKAAAIGDLILLEQPCHVEFPVTVEVGAFVCGDRDFQGQQPAKPPFGYRTRHKLNVGYSRDIVNYDIGGLNQGIGIQPDMEKIVGHHRKTSLSVRGGVGLTGSGRLSLNRDVGEQCVEVERLAEDAIRGQMIGMKTKIRASRHGDNPDLPGMGVALKEPDCRRAIEDRQHEIHEDE